MSLAHNPMAEAESLEALAPRGTLESICRSVASLTGARTAVTSPDGRSLGATAPEPAADCYTTDVVYQGRVLGKLRVSAGTTLPAEAIAKELNTLVQGVVLAGHKSALASSMQIATVEENYRMLTQKNSELVAAIAALEAADRMKSNFLAMISHELRTPLTSIIGYSDMLMTGLGGPLNEDQTEFVETIQRKGEHLLALITSLLELTRLDQGKVYLQTQAVKPSDLLDEVASTFVPRAEKKGVRIESTDASALAAIHIDRVRIVQVLTNLVDNALKFTASGGVVRLSAVEHEETRTFGDGARVSGGALLALPERFVTFVVEDTGVGIRSQDLERIFDPFYQVDNTATRQHGGAGLGLAISERLIRAHGGRIDVSSELGHGTRFRVTLAESPAARNAEIDRFSLSPVLR